MSKLNFFRIALVVVAVLILVHYAFLTRFFSNGINTTIEVGLSVIEIILIYGYVKLMRNAKC
ncbi:hypothetical protein [Nicoliella lavandulae]|uniref:Uncharacterized protein n=1 Tax=Nicoliella lavandulae TaxID=3082954 RepID=A0ABU8SIS9_9LACO